MRRSRFWSSIFIIPFFRVSSFVRLCNIYRHIVEDKYVCYRPIDSVFLLPIFHTCRVFLHLAFPFSYRLPSSDELAHHDSLPVFSLQNRFRSRLYHRLIILSNRHYQIHTHLCVRFCLLPLAPGQRSNIMQSGNRLT